MSKFLYGAAVQGIQNFILQTNKLREIVGASEMVAQICSQLFIDLVGGNNDNLIQHAAGNVKYIFNSRQECEKIVKSFPKIVMTYAPGITLSQAVVEFDGSDFSKAVDSLERKLRIQRNRPIRSQTLGLMGVRRSRQTGLPAVDGKDFRDDASIKKLKASDTLSLCRKSFGIDITRALVAYDIKDITDKNDWIAVIHADGNGLGRIVQVLGKNGAGIFKKFSEDLDMATQRAANKAFAKVQDRFSQGIIPIRPIVLSGDDFTAICRADLAIDYTKAFIAAFEEETTGIFNGIDVFSSGAIRDRMSACAGIAYVKASYPYYYAYDLAEELCSEAKKDVKDKDSIRKGEELPPSGIMFHKVLDSFNTGYSSIEKRELSPTPGISLKYGPYYLSPKKGRWTIEELQMNVSMLSGDDGNAVKSTIRRWLSALHRDSGQANQLLQRAQLLYGNNEKQRQLLDLATSVTEGRTPAYDLLVIHTINTQRTNE